MLPPTARTGNIPLFFLINLYQDSPSLGETMDTGGTIIGHTGGFVDHESYVYVLFLYIHKGLK